MPRITPFKVALACGVAGAYVDVTASASWTPGEGVAGSWGKQDQFRDTTPGAYSFYLDNYDGRFTPDATNGILATPLTEGMGVNWQLGTRLIAGSILGFTMIEDNWGRIRVDVDDMLGNLARNTITLTGRAMVLGARPYLYWPFNDAVGSTTASEQSGNQQLPFSIPLLGLPIPTFGAAAIGFIGETQMLIGDPVLASPQIFQTDRNGLSTINYTSGSMGCWGAWFTSPVAPLSQAEIYIHPRGFTAPGGGHSFGFGVDLHGNYLLDMGGASITGVAVRAGVPAYLQVVVTNSGSTSITGELFVNGVSQGTCVYLGTGGDPNGLSTNAQRTPGYLSVESDNSAATAISHLSHTPLPVPEYLLANQTEAGILAATAATSFGVTIGTLPSDLSIAPSAPQPGAASALSKVNDVIRSEQGYLNCTTTGTLLAPVQTVTVRARQRPAAVAYSFDAQTELAGQPDFIRDLTNLVATETAQGPTTSTTWLDATVSPRAGSSNNTDQIVSTQYVDQLGFAQDRVIRGKNTALHVLSFTVDALHTPTDRSADLLAIAFGDRARITDIPATVTGFTFWDGWVIGRSEAHDRDQHKFTFYAQAVLPATGIYDTDMYANGGNNTISTTLTNVATSMLCTSADVVTLFETSVMNYYLQVDSEVVKVTACSAPVAGVQTLTITRAQFSTAAAAHAVGAVPEVYADSTGRLNNGIYAF